MNGYAYKCDNCGRTTLSETDKLMRPSPPPKGWIAVQRGEKIMDFCDDTCLLSYAWDRAK